MTGACRSGGPTAATGSHEAAGAGPAKRTGPAGERREEAHR